ncbi:hypothetical protein OAO93_06425, partial [Balneolaceae bacterium]|nr:hypothetical protein [Balneolaceae bacterium]
MRFLTSFVLLFFLLRVSVNAQNPTSTEPYFPGIWGEWEMLSPAAAGFDSVKLQEAIDFAISME